MTDTLCRSSRRVLDTWSLIGWLHCFVTHPELAGAGGDLVIIYFSNHTDFKRLVDDESLYFPRFVRVTL